MVLSRRALAVRVLRGRCAVVTSEPNDDLLIRAEAAHRAVIADPRHGRKLAEEIAGAARSARVAEARVVALRAAGWAARELYDHDAAVTYLGQAVRTARRAGLRDRLREALLTRATAYLELGHVGRARRDLSAAYELATEESRTEIALSEGLVEEKAGNFDAAAAAHRRALEHVDPQRSDQRVRALNNLALEVARFGRYEEAERLLDEALELAKTFSVTYAGFVAESRAIVAIAGGRHVVALRRYEDAERRLTAVGAQLVDLYLGKANALLALRLLDEAADAARRAVAQVEGVSGGTLMLAEALLPQARIALARGEFVQARAVAARAEDLFRRQQRRGWRAVAALLRLSAQVAMDEASPAMLRNLRRLEDTMRDIRNRMGTVEACLLYGEVAACLGRDGPAVAAYGRAADAARRGTVLLRLRGRRAAALRAELLGDSRRLGQVCRRGLDELAEHQTGFASIELRSRAAAHGRVLAEIGLRGAVRAGRAEQIWNWLERGHAMAFVRGAGEAEQRLRPLLTELRAREHQLQDMSPDAAMDRADVIRSIGTLERRIRNVSWARHGNRKSWTSPSVRSLRELRNDLGDRLLLQYGVLDGRIHAVAVKRHGLRARDLGPTTRVTTAVRYLAFALRRLASQRSPAGTRAAIASARQSLDQVTDVLVTPFRDDVDETDEVIIVASGDLMGIPWGVLGPLADGPVRVSPSATAWQRSRAHRPSSDRVVLVAGPGVPAADAEVLDIAAWHGHGATLLTGDDASSTRVIDAGSGARLIHVASHGRLRADSPTFSSMQLRDGPLTVHDLEGMNDPAHHWVLAACDLGSPGTFVGRELEGVLAALLAGGAGAIVAAVVSVPDLSTRSMMVELHRCLSERLDLAHALHRARSAVDRDEPAGFVSAIAFSCYGGG